jgi:hypothetical protein
MVRRQREAQLDFLHAGLLQQQFDTDFETKLGKLLYTGKVTVSEGNPEETQEEVVELDRHEKIMHFMMKEQTYSPSN